MIVPNPKIAESRAQVTRLYSIPISRYKRVIGDALRSRTDQTEATEVALATAVLNRMLAFGRPNYIRIS